MATLVALVLPLVALALYLAIAILYAVTSQGVAVGATRPIATGADIPDR